MTGEQPSLFDMPAPPRRPARLAAPRRAVGYMRYRPRRHTLCDDCVRRIHEQGQGNAPYPRTVRWRRIDQALAVVQLCDECKQTREANDGKGP